MNSQQQNDDGNWVDATPLPFLGEGVDWEVYDEALSVRAVGYIGHRKVAEVTARSQKILRLKMFAAGIPFRNTAQASGDASEGDDR